MKIIVINKLEKIHPNEEDIVVDTTSSGGKWSGLSPFIIGPCKLYNGFESKNMENAWQFSKCYLEDTENNEPTEKYWQWAKIGWNDKRAHRYPKGKGRKPLYSLWNGKKLDYIQARKSIYVPLYAQAVQKTESYNKLKFEYYREKGILYLRDWDGWRMEKYGMKNLTEVLNEPNRKMGHAFVLHMLLTNDEALEQCDIRL